MRRYVTELQPANIRELSAMVALFRPGPMEHIPSYIELKHGRSTPYYPHPDLAGVLDETYGVMVYQDQVLQIARTFAGYSLGQADVMRKAMGKKIPAVMLAERDNFVKGCLENGYEQKLAEDLFDLIEPFAGYGFNKAHAFTYGTIAYQTAYLKAHYPVEYMAAVLMSASGSQDRITAAIAECRRMRIAVLPPDVSCSQANFSVEVLEDGSSAIRYGLAQVKNVGEGGIAVLIAERDAEGPFTSLENFARRINPREVNKRVIESLAQAGALDAFGERGTLIGGVARVLSLAQQEQRLRETGQSSMFDLFGAQVDTPLPALELQPVEVPRQELLALEREVLGTYISEHPIQQAARDLERYVTHQSVEVTADLGGHDVVVAGMVASVRSLTTRQGKPFAALTIEDLSGQAELTIWPDSYEQHRELFTEGTVVLAKLQVRTRGDRLTLAVQAMCRYSFDARALIDFEEQKFAIGRHRPRVAEDGARYGAAERSGDGPGRGPRPSGGGPQGGLRVIPPRRKEAEMATANGADVSGPRRLRVDLEETMDEAADLRRLHRVCAALDRHPANGNGTLPVELRVQLRDSTRTSLDRGAIDPAAPEALIPELNALLGVLGGAAEVGTAAAASGGVAVAGGG